MDPKALTSKGQWSVIFGIKWSSLLGVSNAYGFDTSWSKCTGLDSATNVVKRFIELTPAKWHSSCFFSSTSFTNPEESSHVSDSIG